MSTSALSSLLLNDARRFRAVLGLAVAVVSTSTALAVTLLTVGAERRPTFFLFAAAIVVSTLVGGWVCGLFATVLTLVTGAYFLLEPHGSLLINDRVHLMHLVIGSLALIALAVGFDRYRSETDLQQWLEWMENRLKRREKRERSNSPYDLFASVYGRHFGLDTRMRLLPIHEKLMLDQLSEGAHVLDLCCGSGELADALCERGFQLTGIDNSAEMLRLARTKAPKAAFLLADARYFELPELYAGALCTFNSLAHIHRLSDLQAVFRNVNRALLPGGWFVFDLFMEEAYLRRWRGTFSIVENGQVCVVNASYDAERRLGRNDITVFERGSEWKRGDLTLLQKCYSENELREALTAAGFSDIRQYDGGRDFELHNEEGRAFFVCRKEAS